MCIGGTNPVLRALPFLAIGIIFAITAILLFTQAVFRRVNPELLWAVRATAVLLAISGFLLAFLAYTTRLKCG